MTNNLTVCSCGETETHSVARRKTFDGVRLVLWSNGNITGPLGLGLVGVPLSTARTPDQQALKIDAGWLVLGEAETTDFEDLGDLVASARWAAKRDRRPGTVRARMAELQSRRRRPRPVWTTLEEDRQGTVKIRVWRPHRLSKWARSGVWHERGVYTLAPIIGDDTLDMIKGLTFTTLKGLLDHMGDPENDPTGTVLP